MTADHLRNDCPTAGLESFIYYETPSFPHTV